MIDKGMPISAKSLTEKDTDLIEKINIILPAVKIDNQIELGIRDPNLPLDYLEEHVMGQLPTDHRILIEEYYKVLYLNNKDKDKYNFDYWLDLFKVEPQTLRNIFNYVYFPIPSMDKPEEIDKVLYFQDPVYEKRRKLLDKMTVKYIFVYLLFRLKNMKNIWRKLKKNLN